MNSIQSLLNMICTEAVEGGVREHYFDTARNREFIPLEAERNTSGESKLPPIRYNLELIENSDGTLYWVE